MKIAHASIVGGSLVLDDQSHPALFDFSKHLQLAPSLVPLARSDIDPQLMPAQCCKIWFGLPELLTAAIPRDNILIRLLDKTPSNAFGAG